MNHGPVCPGSYQPPTEMRVAPERVQGLRYGRGRCSGCPKTIALRKDGTLTRHTPKVI